MVHNMNHAGVCVIFKNAIAHGCKDLSSLLLVLQFYHDYTRAFQYTQHPTKSGYVVNIKYIIVIIDYFDISMIKGF